MSPPGMYRVSGKLLLVQIIAFLVMIALFFSCTTMEKWRERTYIDDEGCLVIESWFEPVQYVPRSWFHKLKWAHIITVILAWGLDPRGGRRRI